MHICIDHINLFCWACPNLLKFEYIWEKFEYIHERFEYIYEGFEYIYDWFFLFSLSMLLQFFCDSDVLKQCPLYLYPNTLVECSLLRHAIDINLSMTSTGMSIDLTPSTVYLGYHNLKDDKVELTMLHYKCPPSDNSTSLKKLTGCC
jgi:hypothetical protein